jgi:hypothetical protein
MLHLCVWNLVTIREEYLYRMFDNGVVRILYTGAKLEKIA